MESKLITFLKEELCLSAETIQTALSYQQKNLREAENPNKLALVLWEYEMISLEQLELLCDWIENKRTSLR